MNMIKMCLNWRVVGALAAVGIGIWFVAPGVLATALPLLFLAACPLSMLFMVKAMGGMGGNAQAASGEAGEYTCPMHRQVTSATPGRCPHCGMALVPAPTAARGSVQPAERLDELKLKLVTVQAEQEALRLELAAAQRKQAIQDAETIASNADRRASNE